MQRIVVSICAMLLGVAVHGQAPTIQVWIAGDVTVTTSNSLTLTAVGVKGRMWRDGIRSVEEDVVFCVTHAKPIAAKLNYSGPGKVVYRTKRSGGAIPNGSTAEKMTPALGVVKTDGEYLAFLAEGQQHPHPSNERSIGHLTTLAVAKLVKYDVRDLNGIRQKTAALSCLESER